MEPTGTQEKQEKPREGGVVHTIGHSNHSLEQFIGLLRMARITAVADVRSAPYSRYSPHFNKADLKDALKREGITYVYLGKELGGRSDDPACFDGDRISYGRLSKSRLFLEGLERVREGAEKYQVALMCAEKDPLDCHRHLLVSRNLQKQGMRVMHILADGQIENHETSEQRLLREQNAAPGQGDLLAFGAIADPLDEAYERRVRAVAYHRQDQPSEKTA